jgi:hypothetical protein
VDVETPEGRVWPMNVKDVLDFDREHKDELDADESK